MFGSAILDVAIGLISIFLFLSLIGTAINEWISGVLKLRSKNLEEGIRNILNDPDGSGLAKEFYDHPLIKSLSKTGEKPSYIPSRLFALTLLDKISSLSPEKESNPINQMRKSVDKIQNEDLKKNILIQLEAAGNSINKLRENIEKWFDEGMERVSGWYKRKSQWIILVYGLIVAIGLNVDTISVTNALYRDSALRIGMVSVAEEVVKKPISESPADKTKSRIEKMREEFEAIRLPIGWEKADIEKKSGFTDWILRICGWFITAFAVTLGAPFWFDVLNKIINIRASGMKPKISEGEKKEESP